jgi:uncharacterized protein (TIGR02001 family)
MRKSVLALSVAAALAAPGLAAAQTPAPAPTSPIAGNMSLVSEYRFRGIDQTFGKPAIQGGFDYSHSSGIYVGNWNSNVSSGAGFPNGNIEMDLYGGWKKAFGDFGVDLGAIFYLYPGTDPKIDNKEVYVGGSWKWLSAKFYYAVDDYFSIPNTKNSYYTDLSGTYDLGGGWGVVGHLGFFKLKNISDGDYKDWKLGVTKELIGWTLGAAYVDTDAKGDCGGTSQFYCFPNTPGTAGTKFKDAGRATIVFSVSKTF